MTTSRKTFGQLIFGSMTSALPALATAVVATGLPDIANAQAQDPTSSGGYCLALRGNGESQPAHWGALANVVERLGLPEMQSGGSSATLSLMLLENVAMNPLVDGQDATTQRARASLLLKSLHGISNYLLKTPRVRAGLTYAASLSQGQEALLERLKKSLENGSALEEQVALAQLARDLFSFGLGDSPRYRTLLPLIADPRALMSSGDEKRIVSFYLEEIQRAFRTMGSFNAEGDASLFFRDGVVNFERLGFAVGRVATFLSSKASDTATRNALRAFVTTCERLHEGKAWSELVKAAPSCGQLLEASLDSFFSQGLNWNEVNAALQMAGSKIPTLPTTAVLVGSAHRSARDAYQAYHRDLDRSVAERFAITDRNDVKLGYWGPAPVLDRIARNLRAPFRDGLGRTFDFSRDAKSSMFLPLGPATWRDVLSLSPAEPGLASFQPMTVDGKAAFSAGGWSDLHPVPVLKAAGCDRVVYVTRKGGESLFGQGVAKRLLNLERDWSHLRTSDERTKTRNARLNNIGDAGDVDTLWSRLYNVANPSSSFMVSVASADAVLCTDWNKYDVKTELQELVEESYRAPFVVPQERNGRSGGWRSRLTSSGARIVGHADSVTNGVADWVGCRAPTPTAN